MQTKLAPPFHGTPFGDEAESILRKCVHCGFCLATCPTYQLLGDELDSPRGRIYLMKQVLEGATPTAKTQLHLDRCLTCRSCETTCPSGVQYGRLLDIGREVVERQVGRSAVEMAKRGVLKRTLPNTRLFGWALALGRLTKPLLPRTLARKIGAVRPAGRLPAATHARQMLLLEGCVQPAMVPSINAAARRVFDRLGIALVAAPDAGCCGALPQHLADGDTARTMAKRNIDAWWPHIDAGTEAIVVTASGCGTMVADYGHLLRDDPDYAARAARVSALFRDLGSALAAEREPLAALLRARPVDAAAAKKRIAFHAPCSLQHGLKIKGVVEELLRAAGLTLTAVPDAHLCCGSAGTYSLLQPALSQRLLADKVAALKSGRPDEVATANIGCLAHLEAGLAAAGGTAIRHWIELIDERLGR